MPILKTTGKRVWYTLDSTLEAVNTVEQIAEKFATDAGFDEEELHKITMAVREAAVNAVLHGNAYDPSKKVTVGLDSTGDSLVISIADQGAGLDETNIPDPLAPENLLRQSGRGIFLIRAFMDEVRFRPLSPGTEITLVKHRGKAADSKEGSQ
ncbi:MAG TPA: ATP-binding protein [Terriglobales bacterium]|nr:ATP-binding protein [Terriglobales bacterium]